MTGRPVVVVPDVTGQAYVFAKGMLEDAGFAWRVGGSVQGYAANVVAVQQPAAGTRVFDTGAPTIVLRLARGHYPESGLPDDASSFAGTRIRLVDVPVQAHPVAKPKAHALHPRVKPAHSKVKPAHAKKAAPRAPLARTRPAAFAVPGAPKEPLDEMTLPARAELLSTWVNAHQKPTNANVRHWLYQHAWLIEGAKFGWWHGAQALETLVAVDRRVEALWGIGYRSESVARATLARVRAQEAK